MKPSSCTSILFVLAVLFFWALFPRAVLAAVDAPCSMRFDFLAETDFVYGSFEEIEEDAPFSPAESTESYASSAASDFGMGGVLLFAGFILDAPGGQRYGMLFVDLDLSRIPQDPDSPFSKSAFKARYLEMKGDEVVFRGSMVAGDVWMIDWFTSNDDKGAVEGDFAFIFQGEDGGCRVLERGMFITKPSPVALRSITGKASDSSPSADEEYSSVGCDGDVLFVGDSGGCGGEDPGDGSSGCEGDTSSDSGGCEGDTSSDSGSASCEGDSSGDGCSGSESGGCDDGGDSGACSGSQANAAVVCPVHHRRGGGLIAAVMRMFPELTAFAFIFWLKRRQR